VRSTFKAIESRVLWLILILVIPSVAQEIRSSSREYESSARPQMRKHASSVNDTARDLRSITARGEGSKPRNADSSENRDSDRTGISNAQIIFEWMGSNSFPIGNVEP
jgi:hypothetical protein